MSAAKTKAPSQLGGLSAKLLQLAAETLEPEPIQLPDGPTIKPLTRTRFRDLHAAEMKSYLCSQLLQEVLGRTKPDDVSDEDWAQTHNSEVAAVSKTLEDAQADYERAFLGPDVYQEVLDYFEGRPQLWEKVIPVLKEAFLPKPPDNGVCPTCGHVDEEQAGKAD